MGTIFSHRTESDHLKMECNTVREELFLKIKSDVCKCPQFHNLQTCEVAPDCNKQISTFQVFSTMPTCACDNSRFFCNIAAELKCH